MQHDAGDEIPLEVLEIVGSDSDVGPIELGELLAPPNVLSKLANIAPVMVSLVVEPEPELRVSEVQNVPLASNGVRDLEVESRLRQPGTSE